MSPEQRRAKYRRYLIRAGKPTLVRGPALKHVQRKIRAFHARGMSYRAMSSQTGVSTRTICEAVDSGGMLRRNWEPLNAMVFTPPAGRELVSALGTERRLGALWRDGFSMDFLAANYPEVMCRSQLQKTLRGFGKRLVTASTAAAVEQLYRKLEVTRPEDLGISPRSVSYSRTFAAKKGYAPRHCWDLDTIDDPEAIPEWTGACGTPQGLRIHYEQKIPTCAPCLATRDPARKEAGSCKSTFSGSKLKAAREARGLSITQLGEMLDVHRDAVYYWETGRSAPRTQERVSQLCTILGVPESQLTEESA